MIKAFETSLDASNPQNLALFTQSEGQEGFIVVESDKEVTH